MNKLLSAFQDDTGAVSTMRIVVFLLIVAVIGSKFYNSWLTKTPIVWDSQDFTVIGGALGAKLIQNTQENSTPTPPKA